MEQHRGAILELALRKKAYPISALASKLGISRTTLYNKFREHDLSYDFILQVGYIIHYDFTHEFPTIRLSCMKLTKSPTTIWRLEHRYARMLEHYEQLFSFLTRVTHRYHLKETKEAMDKFLKVLPARYSQFI